MSDIHGQYEAFLDILNKIKLSDNDSLYILGDIIDRGPKSLEIYNHIKDKHNIFLIKGNHEKMMLDYYKEINNLRNGDEGTRIRTSKSYIMDLHYIWSRNGGGETERQIQELPEDEKTAFLTYIDNCPYYYDICVNNQKYLLCHSRPMLQGFTNFEEAMKVNIETEEILWSRNFLEYPTPWGYHVIHGHTPVPSMLRRCHIDMKQRKLGNIITRYNKGEIFNIDCGCAGKYRLACLRLDDLKTFYSENME